MDPSDYAQASLSVIFPKSKTREQGSWPYTDISLGRLSKKGLRALQELIKGALDIKDDENAQRIVEIIYKAYREKKTALVTE